MENPIREAVGLRLPAAKCQPMKKGKARVARAGNGGSEWQWRTMDFADATLGSMVGGTPGRSFAEGDRVGPICARPPVRYSSRFNARDSVIGATLKLRAICVMVLPPCSISRRARSI